MDRSVILLVDNYDSFTFNLWQALAALGEDVLVRRNDAISVADVTRLAPKALILSPGPGRPEHAGVTPELVDRFKTSLPILGVCLGHQAIGLALGASVIRCARPLHGQSSAVRHRGDRLFAGINSPLVVGRYHSLTLERSTLPAALHVTAETDDGTIMAIEHREWPMWGVQFHPESVLTPEGPRLLANFIELARAAAQ